MRELFEKEWLPNAMKIGISYNEFWGMNPHIVMIHLNAYNDRLQEEVSKSNTIAYINGIYVVEALLSTVGNMFAKKGAKPHKYPDKPIEMKGKERELTENELDAHRKLFMAQLETMQSNFNNSKKDSI